MGQISSQNSLRSFKNTYTTEFNVFSGTSDGSPASKNVEFHHIRPEYADHLLTRALGCKLITKDDRTLIEQHVAWVGVTSNIRLCRINKLTFHLVKWMRFLPVYRTNSIEDIYTGINKLKAAVVNGHHYSPNTLRDDISALKKFYFWMIKKGYTSIKREEIKEIRVPPGSGMLL
jgi:hypothetical protein